MQFSNNVRPKHSPVTLSMKPWYAAAVDDTIRYKSTHVVVKTDLCCDVSHSTRSRVNVNDRARW